MKKIVRQALLPLTGLPLRQVGRSGMMFSAHFGNLLEIPGPDHSIKKTYEWTVQVQCAWRIAQGTRIIVAYRDFYYSDVPLKNLDVMNKKSFNSVLDGLCQEFESSPPIVTAVESDDTGGFALRLSRDYGLEVFTDENPESGKHWRIFEAGNQGRSFVFPPSET